MLTKNLQEFKALIASTEGRLLGLDVGRKKIGIALSDTLRTIATPQETLLRKTWAADLGVIAALIEKHTVQAIVVGWPMQMNGVEGDSCDFVRVFVEKLQERIPLPVLLKDERMSTAAVQRVLHETRLTRQKKNVLDDKMAAGYVLQGALDQMKEGEKGGRDNR